MRRWADLAHFPLGRPKTFSKKFEKSVDNRRDLCYTLLRSREEDTEMMNWYMNPENHSEDYEELQDLLRDLAEDAED